MEEKIVEKEEIDVKKAEATVAVMITATVTTMTRIKRARAMERTRAEPIIPHFGNASGARNI